MRSSHALKRWLHQEILGEDIGRKPPKRESVLHQNKPARNYRYRAWIRSLPCAGCGLEPCGEAAHTGTDGGKGQKPSDYSCVPLCAECHRLGPGAYHGLNSSAGDFERRHGLNFAKLTARLRKIWFRTYLEK